MIVLWVVPDWAGSGQFLHTFHSATVSGEPTQILNSSNPAAKLTGGALGILVAPVWIAALVGAVLGCRIRDRTTLALTVTALSWFVVTIGGEAIGYPAVPRYLVEPAAVCCVLAGIGFVMAARLIPEGPARVAAIVLLVAVCVPFAVARSIGLGNQVTAANQRADDLSDLWRSVDRAGPRAELAALHPVIAPNKNATGLAWKLHVKLNGVAEKADRRAGVLFAEGNPPAIAQLPMAALAAMLLDFSCCALAFVLALGHDCRIPGARRRYASGLPAARRHVRPRLQHVDGGAAEAPHLLEQRRRARR